MGKSNVLFPLLKDQPFKSKVSAESFGEGILIIELVKERI